MVPTSSATKKGEAFASLVVRDEEMRSAATAGWDRGE